MFNPAEVGSEGKGYRWKSSSLDDTEEDELAECIWGEMSAIKYYIQVRLSFDLVNSGFFPASHIQFRFEYACIKRKRNSNLTLPPLTDEALQIQAESQSLCK